MVSGADVGSDACAVSGAATTVDVMVGISVATGAEADDSSVVGCSASADGMAVTEGRTGGVWGTLVSCGASLTGLGGFPGVVEGPVPGSPNAGAMPTQRVVNKIAVPAASLTTIPRPRQVRLIGSRFLSSLKWRAPGNRTQPLSGSDAQSTDHVPARQPPSVMSEGLRKLPAPPPIST